MSLYDIRDSSQGRRKKLVRLWSAAHHNCVGVRNRSVISKAWIAECKEILEKTKSQVRLYLGEEPPDIKAYAYSYKSDLQRPWTSSQWEAVFASLHQVQVVFGGDFHPFAQAQRTHLRVLRKMIQDRPIVLAVECLCRDDQEWVDSFLSGDLSEEEFLQKVEWEQKWGFPWGHYKPLFDFACKHKIPVVGLNVEVGEQSGAGLAHRDQKAAQTLHQVISDHPESLIYVLYGDLHIAKDHLPAQFKKKQGPSADFAILYLNSEKIYFELAEKGLEGVVEVVQFEAHEFCVLSSPPWVKWHSYLMYLEENFDVDLDWDEDEDGEWEFKIDHTDHISDLVKMVARAIGVEVRADALEVYSLNDPQARVVVEKSLPAKDYAIAHTLIRQDRSFFLPEQSYVYLSKSTVNHAATMAAQYVHAQICGRNNNLWSFPDHLRKIIWLEAMSFLLSKFVNPKRKSQTMGDLKKQLEAFDKEDHGRDPLLVALDQKMMELLLLYSGQPATKSYKPREKSSYVLAARFMGEIMGDRYFVLYQQRIIGIDNIRTLLQQSLERPEFEDFYLRQLKSLDELEMGGRK